MGSKEKLTETASESDLSDGDSDHELQHVLKSLGVMRVGGRWQRQGERAASSDSTDSSEASGKEDGDIDIDAKMDALRAALHEAYPPHSSRSTSSEED